MSNPTPELHPRFTGESWTVYDPKEDETKPAEPTEQERPNDAVSTPPSE